MRLPKDVTAAVNLCPNFPSVMISRQIQMSIRPSSQILTMRFGFPMELVWAYPLTYPLLVCTVVGAQVDVPIEMRAKPCAKFF
jgi:hypothetical protein